MSWALVYLPQSGPAMSWALVYLPQSGPAMSWAFVYLPQSRPLVALAMLVTGVRGIGGWGRWPRRALTAGGLGRPGNGRLPGLRLGSGRRPALSNAFSLNLGFLILKARLPSLD